MQSLPIDAIKNEILESLDKHSTIILQAPPGSGKTTRVPQFLIEKLQEKIIVLEPRRLAAKLSAERIAAELKQSCGNDVGYHIRYERLSTPQTRILFMTEGLFLRTLLSNPTLDGISYVVLDEFHERHLHSDVAYVLTRALQESQRNELKLILMSATLDTEKLGAAIPNSCLIKTEVPTHPVHVEYETSTDQRALEIKVSAAVDALLTDSRCPGHILVFLPGAADIRRAAQLISQSKHAGQFDLLELRADTTAREQRKVFEEGALRKVILATNVAETSVTIPGVTGVVDSGLAKVSAHAHWNGLPTLDVRPISQSSAIQRSGRAGRTAPGIARRLFTRADFQTRPFQDKPEIQRADLTQVMLEVLVAMNKLSLKGKSSLNDLDWIDEPQSDSVTAAHSLLMQLGALTPDGKPNELAERMSRWPLHPRLARVLEEGRITGNMSALCLIVSIMNEGYLLKRGLTNATTHTDCDLHFQANLFLAAERRQSGLKRSEAQLIDDAQLRKIARSFSALCKTANSRPDDVVIPEAIDDCSPFAQELLTGFSDRVVSFRKTKTTTKFLQEVVFSKGGLGQLSPVSTVQESDFGIALHAEQIRRQGATHFTTEVTAASGVSRQTLKRFFHADIVNESAVVWDEQAEKAKSLDRTILGALILEERPTATNPQALEQELFNQLKARWPRPFHDISPILYFQTRLKILQSKYENVSDIDLLGEDFELFLTHLCEGKKSFAELTATPLTLAIESFLPAGLNQLLSKELPLKIKLNSGRLVDVHYKEGQPPWLSSRMQDFFGTMQTPRVLSGSIPITTHLLAPNGQAVQVTTQLESFWQNTYPEVRKELSRRYPRHFWPEDPKTAEPLTRRPKPDRTQAGTSRSK